MAFFIVLAFALLGPDMEYTLQEERSAKGQVEEKLLQLKKDHSMLDCDYKLVQNKLDELQAQKEKLSEEVTLRPISISISISARSADL